MTKWIKSFLMGRTQQVKIDHSDVIFFPLLFQWYPTRFYAWTNIIYFIHQWHITNVCKFGKLIFYADDVTLYATVNNITDANHLQADLNNIALNHRSGNDKCQSIL